MDPDEGRCRYRGSAYCHVPANVEVDLDDLVGGDDGDERWNRRGQPTLYLAGDVGVAIAEFARHLETGPHDGSTAPQGRRLLRLDVAIDGLFDLREPEVAGLLDAPSDPSAYMDREVARAVAGRARSMAGCRGLIVPSMAYLDDLSRWNLLAFMDRIPGGVAEIVAGWQEVGRIELGATRSQA